MSDLVVVYGSPFSGKTEVAWAIARAMPGKSAVVSADALLGGAIALPWDDARAELEMAHGQLRLLVAFYLKHSYHLVVEGPFLFQRNGALISYESHVDQLIALMRNLTLRSLIVRLNATDEVLRERSLASTHGADLAAALTVSAAYRARAAEGLLTFDTATHTPDEIAAAVQAELAKVPPLGRRR